MTTVAALSAIGPLVIVAGAMAVGHSLPSTLCHSVVPLSALTGMVLALIAVFRRSQSGNGLGVERIAGFILILYVVVAGLSEQFAWVGNARQMIIAIGWLTPLIVGSVVLPRLKCWFAGFGYWLVLFSGVAALVYTVSNYNSGMGLFSGWLG